MKEYINNSRFNSIGEELKREFGRRVVKLGIDAGFTCPNRDGTCGYGGCAFCSGDGSGELAAHLADSGSGELATHLAHDDSGDGSGELASHIVQEDSSGLRMHSEYASSYSGFGDLSARISDSITEQIGLMSDKWPDAAYIAYFQSHTNTYAPATVLRKLYYAALDDPRISGIAIATRPDCLPPDVLDLLEEISREHYMWVELGLQTMHEKTAREMNIGYSLEVYDKAVDDLISRGIRVVTHLILGLPGETQDMMLSSVRHVCRRNIFGIKLHLMNIVRTSRLGETMPDYVPFSNIEEYVDLVVRCLEIIPPDITIHRLTGDVPRRLLISPEWSYRKRTILNSINQELARRDTRQGVKVGRNPISVC